MPKSRELSEFERSQIIALHSEGLSQVAISKRVKCSRCAVQTTIKRYRETGDTKSRPGRGPKRKTTEREDRWLQRQSLINRRRTAKDLSAALNRELHVTVSAKTVSRRLREAGLAARKARKKPWLSETNRKKRLAWAKKYQSWTEENWANVIWSDETNIEVFGTPGAVYVRRRPGEAYRADCVVPTVKHGGGSIMLWGCMSSAGVGELFICTGRMNSKTYTAMLEQVLQPSVEKLYGMNTEGVLFQQDNAPCHTAASSKAWFNENNVDLLEWPPQSPDLNPIEHLWAIIKQKVHQHKCTSKRDLEATIKNVWQQIPESTCQSLVSNLPKRIKAVIKARGGPTKY